MGLSVIDMLQQIYRIWTLILLKTDVRAIDNQNPIYTSIFIKVCMKYNTILVLDENPNKYKKIYK